jgi:hypothetical protein
MFMANCPNCGAAISFRSINLPVRVCDYCHSSIVRTGDALVSTGKVADVPEDVSPLQIGVRGSDGGRSFELIGRVRWRWTDGGWNEWLALFSDGSTGWIGEAMGRYMLLRQIATTGAGNAIERSLRAGAQIVLGTEATIDGVKYRVTDVKEATCAGSEGELPFNTPPGFSMPSVDLMAADGHCASIQKDGDDVQTYAGRYVTLADLKPTGLRAFDGWPMPRFAA